MPPNDPESAPSLIERVKALLTRRSRSNDAAAPKPAAPVTQQQTTTGAPMVERRLRPRVLQDRPEYKLGADANPEPSKLSKLSKRSKLPKRSKRPKEPAAPKAGARRSFNIELTPKKIKREEVMNFARQAASFVKAGIPIIDALAIISEDTADKKLREVLAAISVELRAGSSLTSALAKHSASFPKYFVSMIRSAELTGQLDEVLDQLAQYIDRDVETRRKVKSAMTYPSVIFIMAIGTIVVLSVFVLPKFKSFFESFDAKLPWATRALVAITNFMSKWGVTGVFLTAWLIMFFALLTQREPGKLVRDSFYLRIPKLGPLLRIASIERFCRILSVMVRAGVPLPDALAVASDTTGNRVYRRGIGQIRLAIMRGAGMAGPVTETGLFPAAARQMIRVGESTGTLEDQLAASADFYGRELEYKLKRFTDLFEPAIVAFMGLVVGFVAYALVSAMYGIFNQVNG